MKKKNILFLLAFFCFILIANAQPVDITIVKKVALNSYYNHATNITKEEINISEFIPVTNDIQKVLYYIVNFKNEGFSIISAEKAMRPVLANCVNTNFNYDDAPPGLLYLLERYKAEITELRKQNITPSKKDIAQWDKYNIPVEKFQRNNSGKSVAPILNTTWAQKLGYNCFCPKYNSTNHCPAGCDAVAMAQVLQKWGCWVGETGSHSYESDYGKLSANFGNAGYLWSSMDLNYSDNENAKLIYHCGVACEMNYGKNSSVANIWRVKNGLRDYFGFANSIDVKLRASHLRKWQDMLEEQLDKGWPLIYRGGGHAWVLDGYKSDGKFWCNWGWNGSFNGPYALGNFKPNGHNYNQLEGAIFNAWPTRETQIGKPNIIYPNAFEGSSVVLHTRPADYATDYEWTCSPATTATITGTGTTAVLRASGSCQVCVRAHNAQCDIYSYKYCEYIVKGTPNSNNYYIHGPSVVKIRREADYWMDPVPGAYSYEWSVNNEWFLDKDKPIQYYIAGNERNATFYTSNEGCYTIRVKAINEFGSSWQSKQISTTYSNCSSGKSDTTKFSYNNNNKIISSTSMNIHNKTSEITNNIKSKKEITIFPNPASNYISFAIPDNNKKLVIKIVNMQGKIMKTLETEKNIFHIYTKDIDNGFYILQIIGSEKIINKKIQIIK
ncbi:MAG: thiol protease/hemagglutinin PrtT [Bacteroidales bacterium]|nr:thiol protease/hemagglutinin PrtT [Bacteroidales bacterium]